MLDANPDMSIRIKAEPEKRLLHITDSGVGMTKHELINNLGTIAKSGTADFLSKMQDAEQVSVTSFPGSLADTSGSGGTAPGPGDECLNLSLDSRARRRR